MDWTERTDLLNALADKYNNPAFIASDPIQIPHEFKSKQDIEISAFLTATISWGQRGTIIRNARKLMEIMNRAPYDFILHCTEHELNQIHFTHRTLNSHDLRFLLLCLRGVYFQHNSLEDLFLPQPGETNLFPAISRFRTALLNGRDPGRTGKHLANPDKGTAAKRVHMFLRWMVRRDSRGVDFGLWQRIPMSILSCPLDVHTGNVARALKLLNRKANDRRAVEELDRELRKMDPTDPVRYDYALFGEGVMRVKPGLIPL